MSLTLGLQFSLGNNGNGDNGNGFNGNNGNGDNGNGFNGNNRNDNNGNSFNGNNGNGNVGNGNNANGNNGCRIGWILTANSAKTPSCVEPNYGNTNGNGNGNAYSNGNGNGNNGNGNSNWKRSPSWCCPPPVTASPSKKMICPERFWWSENGKGKNCYPLTGYCCC